jgi:hypothetical protein
MLSSLIWFDFSWHLWGCPSHDCMVVGFKATYAFSAYHHYLWQFKSCSWLDVLDTTLCDKVCQWLATVLWFPPPIITDCLRYSWNIVESGIECRYPNPNTHHILYLRLVALNAATLTLTLITSCISGWWHWMLLP